MLLARCALPGWFILVPLYTRSQGQCSTQIQHSYWCKSWNQHPRLYTRSQGWHKKKLFNLPWVSIKCWTLWPCIDRQDKAEKKDTIKLNLGGQFATQKLLKLWEANLRPKNCSNFGRPICNPKIAQNLGGQFATQKLLKIWEANLQPKNCSKFGRPICNPWGQCFSIY